MLVEVPSPRGRGQVVYSGVFDNGQRGLLYLTGLSPEQNRGIVARTKQHQSGDGVAMQINGRGFTFPSCFPPGSSLLTSEAWRICQLC